MEGYMSVISCMGEKLWREREKEGKKMRGLVMYYFVTAYKEQVFRYISLLSHT